MTEPGGPPVAERGLTPSQTVGPFFAIGTQWTQGPYAAAPDAAGAVWIRGRVLDGAGDPVPDAIVETWQASPAVTDQFRAFTRCPTDTDGRWAVCTLKPAPVAGPDGRTQAPHLAVSVFARGLLDRVVTRVYFGDEAAANATDPVLALAGPRGATLVATPGPDGYALDIRLQGDDETLFLSI